MKIFANKNIWKKIIIILLIMLSFSFMVPKPVNATVGGTLMKPISSLLVGFGDGIMRVINKLITGQNTTLIRVEEGESFNKIQMAIIAAVIIAVIVIVSVATAGVADAVAAGVAETVGVFGTIGAVAATIGSTVVKIGAVAVMGVLFFHAADAFSDEIVLPMYAITAEEIVANKVPLFNVNFINPPKDPISTRAIIGKKSTESTEGTEGIDAKIQAEFGVTLEAFKNMATKTQGKEEYTYTDSNGYIYELKLGNKKSIKKYKVVNNQLTEMPFSQNYTSVSESNLNGEESNSLRYAISYELQETISTWYKILRVIAIVGMMSVLVYVGIRIVLSSTASQKAKYKQLLTDWFVGMLLLFTMHYIMNFSIIAVEKISDVLNDMTPTQNIEVIPDKVGDTEGKVKKVLDKAGIQPTYEDPNDPGKERILYEYPEKAPDKTGVMYIYWRTNMMGSMRVAANNYSDGSDDEYIGSSIIFFVMVLYTVIFCFTYLKRLIYLAFLTLISPLVAFTYPIDKVNDGKAQGFNTWFREYIFNLLLQPLHLLLYTILIRSAIELSSKNWIYSLVVMGFMATAENILRKIFNFSKASTPGVFAGPAGAAMTMTGLKWFLGHGPKGGNSKEKLKSGQEDESGSNRYSKPTKTKIDSTDSFDKLISGKSRSEQMDSGLDKIKESNDGKKLPGFNILDNGETQADGKQHNMNKLKGIIDGGNGKEALKGIGNGSNGKEALKGIGDGSNGKKTLKGIGDGKKPDIKKQNNMNIKPNLSQRKRIQNGLGKAWKKYKKVQGRKFVRDAKRNKPIRSIASVLGGLTTGALAGSIGLAAGITSGDPSKAFQYTTVGAASGYKMGSDGIKSLGNTIDNYSVEGLRDDYYKGYLTEDEYKERQNNIKISKLISNDDYISDFSKRTGLSEEESKEALLSYANPLLKSNLDESDYANVVKSIGKEFVMRNDDGTVSSTEIENIDQAILAAQMQDVYGGINDTEKRIDKIMSDTGYDRNTAINFDNARAAYENTKKDVNIGDINKKMKLEQERYNKEQRKAEEEQRKAEEEQRKAEEEQRRAKEEQRKVEEEQRKVEEEQRKEKEKQRKAEEEVRAKEAAEAKKSNRRTTISQTTDKKNNTQTELESKIYGSNYDKYDILKMINDEDKK